LQRGLEPAELLGQPLIAEGDITEVLSWIILAESHDERLRGPRVFISHRLVSNPKPYFPVGIEVAVCALPDDPRVYTFQFDRITDAVTIGLNRIAGPSDPTL
jgi:hypothetical protein